MLNSPPVLKPDTKSPGISSCAICAAIGICLFGWLGALGLTGPDEPRYAWIARAMAQTGDWVTPRLYGQPWFEKPILYYWAAAIGFRLHLPSEWAARLPSAFAALAATLAIAFLARRIYGRGANWSNDPAWLAAIFFSTSIAAIAFARAATPDMLFSASIALAMVCAASILASEGIWKIPDHAAPQIWFYRMAPLLLFGAFLGLATLAKGPAAIILAGGALLFWAAATDHWRAAIRLAHPAAIGAFLVVALPWYVLCALRNPDFLRVFILQHNFERYLTPVFQHRQPFWFFGPIFLAALLPWTPLLWPAARAGLRLWREKSWSNSPGFFFACWTLFPILFFSASQSKLPSYILPAMPAAALLCAAAAIKVFRDGRARPRWIIAAAVFLMAIGVIVASGTMLRRVDGQYSSRPYAQFLHNDAHPNRIFIYKAPRAFDYGLAFYFNRQLPEWLPTDPDPALVLTTKQGFAEIAKLGRTTLTLDELQDGQQALIYVPVNSAPRASNR